MRLPLLALTLGDPAGIGPEIVRSALADPAVRTRARIVALGPASHRPDDVPLAPEDLAAIDDVAWIETAAEADIELGRAQAAAGRAALAALRLGHDLAIAGRVDGLVTAPVCKEALHLAGERVEGQTELLGRWAGKPCEMLAIAGTLRVLLLTRHLPLRDAIAVVDPARVRAHLRLLHDTLLRLGLPEPRIALAGLNPHAGEAGILGDDEIRALEPAAAAARADGLDVHGPISPDVVFRDARDGRYDGVLALYHDQAFIPIKLLAGDGGLTVLAGHPYLRVSPAHGTAFDIAGRGLASSANLVGALEAAAGWARTFAPAPARP